MIDWVVLDARGLEAPEPMERVLTALELLRPGQGLHFLIHREPLPLYGVLASHGYPYTAESLGDGNFAVWISPRH